MNLDKIIPLYNTMESMGAFTAGHPSIPAEKRTPLYMMRLASYAPRTSEQREYRMEAALVSESRNYRNDTGERASGFIDEACPERVAKWVMQQMPGEGDVVRLDRQRGEALPDNELYLLSVWTYEAKGADSKMRFGAKSDFENILRGMASFQRKRRRREKKALAQLAAYHQVVQAAKEASKLRAGCWMGAEKAITTAPRLNDARVPFMGDANLTSEQRQQLRYWAVPQSAGMSAAFPAGTGIALKVITASNQLINGAVYLWQAEFGTPGEINHEVMLRLGRLDNARKTQRGWIPLFGDDDPTKDLWCEAQWLKKTGRLWEGTLMQVVYYTTRAEELAPVQMIAETQPVQPALRSGKKRAQMQAAA